MSKQQCRLCPKDRLLILAPCAASSSIRWVSSKCEGPALFPCLLRVRAGLRESANASIDVMVLPFGKTSGRIAGVKVQHHDYLVRKLCPSSVLCYHEAPLISYSAMSSSAAGCALAAAVVDHRACGRHAQEAFGESGHSLQMFFASFHFLAR